MTERTIKILPIIYTIEVTSHSNNYFLKSFCLECLSHSKVNKQYSDYHSVPNISSNRICSRCGAMTITAVIAAFNVSIEQIIKQVESKYTYKIHVSGEQIKFLVEPFYLSILKGKQRNGKARRLSKHS